MTFRIALSGLNAAQADLGVTANNIANTSTTGFKGSRTEFADMFAVSLQGVSSNATGNGVRVAAITQQFAQGNIEFTDSNLDLAVSGQGMFILSDNGALAYSRPEGDSIPESGVTSDNFIDVANLVYEPHFAEFVKEAFNPLGVMLNFWEEEAAAGTAQEMEVYLVNDRYDAWAGDVTLRVLRDGQQVASASAPVQVGPIGQQTIKIPVTLPAAPGRYTLSAQVTDPDGGTIRSLRDVTLR